MNDTHLYNRQVNIENIHQNSLSLIYSKINEGQTVLDVGAGDGGLGKALVKWKGCSVDGVTYNEEEYFQISKFYRQAWCFDLDREKITSRISGNKYDVIVCGDVLEHLKNAEQVLSDLLQLIGKDGKIILSIPNVTYGPALASLLSGNFPRTNEGIFDSTHLRFFDRKQLTHLCERVGAMVIERDAISIKLENSEFSGINFQEMPTSVIRYIEAREDSGIYQFVWTLAKSPAIMKEKMPSPAYPKFPDISFERVYSLKIYVDRGNGFNEADSIDRCAVRNQGRKKIQIDLDSSNREIRGIRIDWPPPPIVLAIESIELSSCDGDRVLVWRGGESEAIKTVGAVCAKSPLGEPGFLLIPELAHSYTEISISPRSNSIVLEGVIDGRDVLYTNPKAMIALIKRGLGSNNGSAESAAKFAGEDKTEIALLRINETLNELYSYLPKEIERVSSLCAETLLQTREDARKLPLLQEMFSVSNILASEMSFVRSRVDELYGFVPGALASKSDELIELCRYLVERENAHHDLIYGPLKDYIQSVMFDQQKISNRISERIETIKDQHERILEEIREEQKRSSRVLDGLERRTFHRWLGRLKHSLFSR